MSDVGSNFTHSVEEEVAFGNMEESGISGTCENGLLGKEIERCFSSEHRLRVVATACCIVVLATADWNLDLGS